MSSPSHEVAEIFTKFGTQYKLKHKLTLQQSNAMFAIEHCRTAVLGGHIQVCNSCGHTHVFFNSCRNRHCPKCGGLKREVWIDKLSASLLPVKYFHLVFTIPAELNTLAFYNQQCIYDILFKASSQTVMMLTADKKYLGALTGIISILHTWGQNLMQHPHIHMLIPAGGWISMEQRWKSSKRKFLIPHKVAAKVFRGKFLSYLKRAYRENELQFFAEAKQLQGKKYFQGLLTDLYQKHWIVKAKRPFKNCSHIIEYMGRYTHRVAISNHRIK